MPLGLLWFSSTVFVVSCINLILIFASQWWDWSKHGFRSGVLEYIPKDQYATLGTTISAAGITLALGCFWKWRWIRYYIPLFMAGMAIFSFSHNRLWEGYGSLAWAAITAIYLFRNIDAIEHFNQDEHDVAPNRSLPPTLNSMSSVRGSEDF